MKDSTRSDYEERLSRARRYLERHLDEPLSLEELARVACFSPFHFSRIYAAMCGESLMATWRRLRLERAAFALRYSERSITELAFEAGYETLEAFGRGFRKQTGLSPSTYRRCMRFTGDAGLDTPRQALLSDPHPEGGHPMDVTIQTFEDLRVAYLRHIGPYQTCDAAWQKLCSNPGLRASFGPHTLAIGIGYDDPDTTEASKIRLDVCVTIPETFVVPEGLLTQTLQGGEFAVLRHVGSYAGLHDCYRHLYGHWLPKSGREPKAAPAMEIYRNDPDTVSEAELITDLCLPLKNPAC